MKTVCVSASNTLLKQKSSTSIGVCDLIGKIVKRDYDYSADIVVVPLAEYEISPCRLCGDCSQHGKCCYDEDFNKVFSEIVDADVVFWVVPHYSPIPSKLLAVYEKINEIFYASWLANPQYKAPVFKKPTAIIGHGGMAENEKVLKYYHDHLITPIANTLRALSFDVIGLNEAFNNGVAFGLRDENCIRKKPDEVFPDILQDWMLIEGRISPLVERVLTKKTEEQG